MPKIQIIKPIDQPTGDNRLLDWLNSNFEDRRYNIFKCLVAFAKIRPFYKLHENIVNWNHMGNKCEAIIGIDHKGTSYQALQYVLSNFEKSYILHTEHSTFHPKLYIFSGPENATVYYGSSNFTSGGLETNFEGGMILELNLPLDNSIYEQLLLCYTTLLPSEITCTSPLTSDLLNRMYNEGLLLDETVRKTKMKNSSTATTSTTGESSKNKLFGAFHTKPPKSVPKSIVLSASESAGIILNPPPVSAHTSEYKPAEDLIESDSSATPVTVPLLIDGLVMQVAPHYNGEILLSKIATNQNPSFFGYPFTGQTTPKKSSNPTYPQRDPDPIVNIFVYDSHGSLVKTEFNYNLNTVFYEAKAEIRITITPSILQSLDFDGGINYPIMVMQNSEVEDCDYDLYFYAQGSIEYNNYLSICNQTLPSGGKPVARKMGWI